MTETQVTTMILNQLAVFGLAVFTILSSVIAVSVAYLIFHYGYKRFLTDKSLMLGGYYLRSLPVEGYNRFRSQAWNMKNKPWEKKNL